VTQRILVVEDQPDNRQISGFAASLARPGGNVTGISIVGPELDQKRIELLRELLPRVTRVAILGDPNVSLVSRRFAAAEAIGRSLGLTILARPVSQLAEIDSMFAVTKADGDQAVLVLHTPLTFEQRRRIIELAARFYLPTICEIREYVEDGGLLSYGRVWRESFVRAAGLVDKILRGARPAELPFEQPTKHETVINLKTAKALGLTVAPTLLARADEVIEWRFGFAAVLNRVEIQRAASRIANEGWNSGGTLSGVARLGELRPHMHQCERDAFRQLQGLRIDLGPAPALAQPRLQALRQWLPTCSSICSVADIAIDAFTEKRGVCRDFAHLAVTLCRCMNVPARYCTGYLGDIGVPSADEPMDFSACFEAYLGDLWYTFDARHNKPRIGRILMACGRYQEG
jgi:putative tryptophan/tyrosine transport system substrate-binding protein